MPGGGDGAGPWRDGRLNPLNLERFQTARLRAERLSAAHVLELQQMDRDPQVMTYLGGVRDDAGLEAYLERNLAHWDQFGYGVWMLYSVESGGFAGRAVLRHVDVEGRDEVEVGYGFLPAFWGQGLATEITHACLRIAREDVGLSSVVALTALDNAASRKVLEKAGLHFDRQVQHVIGPHALYRIDFAPGSD